MGLQFHCFLYSIQLSWGCYMSFDAVVMCRVSFWSSVKSGLFMCGMQWSQCSLSAQSTFIVRLASLWRCHRPAVSLLLHRPYTQPSRSVSNCVYLCTTFILDFSTVSAASGRYRLRSTDSEAYILPRTRTRFGERGFFYSGPAAWNTLPSDLHDITDTSTFRKRLKNVFFDRAFNWFCWRSWTCRIAAPYKFCGDNMQHHVDAWQWDYITLH